MTQHVRKGYRNYRKATWAIVLGVLVTAALAIALPAIGSTAATTVAFPSDPVHAPANLWTSGGGGTFSCSGVNSAAKNPFFLSSPATGTYTATASNGMTAKIGITISTGSTKDKYMSISMFGGRISDIGIKGGTNVAWYD
jgi:hypothetical protein